jgi:uncharacterized protein YjbI with pentapeptide repeats
MEVAIRCRYTGRTLVFGAYKSVKDCIDQNRYLPFVGADLCNVDLRCADLYDMNFSGADFTGADLGGAWLRGTNFTGANLVYAVLEGAAGYLHSHEVFMEVVRRQPVKTFTDAEPHCRQRPYGGTSGRLY